VVVAKAALRLADVHVLDLRDPCHPKEIGYFIPPSTAAADKRCVKVDGQERCKTAIQSNNVETDVRGYIYVVDRANTGLHIRDMSGEQCAHLEIRAHHGASILRSYSLVGRWPLRKLGFPPSNLG
jgi:hypothetical protein